MHQGIVWIRTLLNPRFALFDPKAVHSKDCERLFFRFYRCRILKMNFVGIGDS